MKPTWLIQSNNLKYQNTSPLVDVLTELKMPYQDFAVIPFSDEFQTPQIEGPRIYYGSTRMVNLAWKHDPQGVFFDPEKFKNTEWRKHRHDLLNQNMMVMSVADAREFCSVNECSFFVRPNTDLKAFAGMVVNTKDFCEWIDGMSHGGYTFEETFDIVLAPVQEIQAEWRYFVVNHRIVSGSMYRCRGQSVRIQENDSAVLSEAQRYADRWLPNDDVVVMDLALTPDGVKLIEFNGFNASGFYAHDLSAIVKAVSQHVENMQ